MKIIMILILVLACLIAVHALVTVHAQSTSPWQVTVTGAHTLCTVTASTTNYCFAADGLWQSLNGAAYTQVGGGTAGVTSVNGKTGVVVLGATSTTTIQ